MSYQHSVTIPTREYYADDTEFEDYLLTIKGMWFRNTNMEFSETFFFEDEDDAIMFALRWS